MDQSALKCLQQRLIVESMNNFHNLEEVKVFISKLDIEMAAEKDGIFAEIFQYCGTLC